MFLLLASIAALCLGPALALVPGRQQQAVAAIDGFVVVAIGGLVLFDILPHSLADAGWLAWLAAAVGLLAPAALHGPLDDCSGRATEPFVMAGALAFAVHAMFDGLALVNHTEHVSLLGWAVVLHRVLEGLAIWWLIRPHQGAKITWMFLGIIAGATLLGFWGGDWALQHGFAAPLGMLQAAVAGSLLHVLLRHAPPDVASTGNRWHLASGAGGLAAMGVLAALLREHTHADPVHHHHGHGSSEFWNLATAGHLAVGLLLAYGVTAILHALWESRTPALVPSKRHPLLQAWAGAWAALTVAECSCGVVPLYRRLLGLHAGRTQALAFLFAAPLWGCSSLVLSWWMLGTRLTLLRAGAALVLSIAAALLARLVAPSAAIEPVAYGAEATHTHQHRSRWADALHFTLGEVLDRSSPWVLFGLILAQLAGLANLEAMRGSGAEVVLFALIATPFYLSATAATVVACALLAAGVSMGAVLAFVLLSSALGLGTISLIKKQYGVKVCALVTAGAWMIAVILGMQVPASWQVTSALAGLGAAAAPDAQPDVVGGVALVCVAGLFVFSLLRQGVRPFLGQVALPNTMGRPSHHHDHDHDHDARSRSHAHP